jgi:hypothetical protein
MSARIFSPAKTAMQSGTARTGYWVLEFDPELPRKIDPLMGYTTSADMKSQIRLTFETREEAIAYAQKNGIAYRVRSRRSGSVRPCPIPRTSVTIAGCPGRTEAARHHDPAP